MATRDELFPPKQHDFRERLSYSEQASTEPFWELVYRTAFPNMVNQMPLSGDTAGQRKGHDRIVYLSNGHTITLDEKKRSQEWPDFLLEYISVDKTGAPGWMEKDLDIDYLAYAYMPIQRVYLLPWLPLRRAWRWYSEQWKEKYGTIRAHNQGYTTLSVPVPRQIVLTEICRGMIVQLPR